MDFSAVFLRLFIACIRVLSLFKDTTREKAPSNYLSLFYSKNPGRNYLGIQFFLGARLLSHRAKSENSTKLKKEIH
jgi:hypothetical protein